MKTNSMPLLLASIAAFAMTMTGYSQSPPRVPVRRRKRPLSAPGRKYGDVSGEEFSVQARREEGEYSLRSVTDEQRSLRRKGPPGTSLYLRPGALRLPWHYAGMAAMLAAVLLPCAAMASPPVVKPSSSFNSQSVFAGASATFTITATGDAPLVYQWRHDEAELPGQTNRTSRIGTTQPLNEGGYDVVVGNASGSVTSYVARLYAVPPTSELTRSNQTNAAGLRLPYFIHLPTGYDPAGRYPLILVFTGGGIDETTIFSVLPAQFFVHTSCARQAANPSLVVYVTRRAGDGNLSWTPQYLEEVAVLVDELAAAFSVDHARSRYAALKVRSFSLLTAQGAAMLE